MKKIYFLLSIMVLTRTIAIAQVTVSGSAGADGDYATLTGAFGAFDVINNNGPHTGNNILITISADIYEVGYASLLEGEWATLTINPTGGVPRQLTTGSLNALINLNGADNVTIDGLNSGGNTLTIINTGIATLANAIRLEHDATHNLIIRCTLLGSSGFSLDPDHGASGVIFFGRGITTGNNNNTVTQCNISSSANGPGRFGIYSSGLNTTVDNRNNIISGNNISDFFHPFQGFYGINIGFGNSNWTITNNRIYWPVMRTCTGGGGSGIGIQRGDGYTITNNVIGYANAAGTGTTNLVNLESGSLGGTFPGAYTVGGTPAFTGIGYIGISCSFTEGGAVSSIQNNIIAGIAIYTVSNYSFNEGILCGIAVNSGNADIGTITGNIIGSSNGSSSIYAASASNLSGAVVSGIFCYTTNNINIQNNIIGGIDVSGTTATNATGFKGIEVAGPGNYTVSNNHIGNATANNIRTGYLLTGANLSNIATTPTPASGTATVKGIVSTATGGTVNINNNVIQGIQVSGTATTFTGISNTGLILNAVNITNNQVGAASTGAVNFIAPTTGAITGISNTLAAATAIINITGNAVQGISCVSSGNLTGIENGPFADSDAGININNNEFGTATGGFVTYSAAATNTIRAVINAGGTGNCVLNIQNNSVKGVVHTVTATAPHIYFSNTATGLKSENIAGNTFNNLNVNTTGNITFLNEAGGLSATGTSSCSNNAIVTAFNKSAPGGDLFIYTSGNNNVNGSVMTETGNNFSNITVSGSSAVNGWQNAGGVSSSNGPARTITGNTFSNITAGSGAIRLTTVNVGGPTNCSNNIFSNITGMALINAINIGALNGQGTHNYSSNTISSLISTGTGGNVTGITGGISGVVTTVLNINNNSISGLSSTGVSSSVEGIRVNNAGSTTNVNDNLVNNLMASGITSPLVAGIVVGNSVSVYVFKNKVTSLGVSAALTTISPSVIGLNIIGGLEVTAYNNFIADLNAPSTNCTDAIQGIRVENSTLGSDHTILYNSVYINAGSNRANFGTTGIWHFAVDDDSWAPLHLINNIIVNTSTANGTGLTVAYRRSNTFLTNYALGSDYNLFYAGNPSASRLIFYDGTNADQTLAAYKARVSTRDANSISLLPAFTSSTDLHLTNANCGIDGKGTPLAITTDIDAATRDITTPDIGADEFTATYSTTTLAGVAGTTVCDSKNVTAAPTVTTYATSVCDLIAKVLPSGGSPVAGRINVCVVRDVSQLYFNGEPYVQRHYDIEPATSPATATATVTLYYTDVEFVSYNALNPVYPTLPTNGAGNTVANRNNVRVTQFHGVGTGSPTSPGNYPGTKLLINPGFANVVWNGSYWAVTFSFTGFSGFYVHTTLTNRPLPIIVNYLTGRKQGSNHLLNWKVTCATSPRATMTLERSADSRNFSDLYSITADAARCNQPFDYTDTNPLIGMNYYRLKIVDADGKVTYSTTVALLNAVKGFDIISIAPNPVVTGNFKLNVASAQAGKMDIAIFDMQGRLVNRQSITLIAGFNGLPVNVANLAAATYTIKASMADDQTKIIRFVKQ